MLEMKAMIQESMTPLRKALRMSAVLAATGFGHSKLYDMISKGQFPKPTKIDPDGRVSVWWEDEVIAFQQRAIERTAQLAGASQR
jgi:predicted DNA-binding transcriptional regulator AlpA